MTQPLASFENPRFRGSRPAQDGAMGRVGFGGVSHSLTTAMVGANNDLVITARRPGNVPASPAVQFTDPGYFTAAIRFVKDGTVASVTLNPASGTDMVISSRAGGAAQNKLNIELIDPGRGNRPLRVFIDGDRIRVYLATDATATITSTAATVVAALNADHGVASKIVAGLPQASAGALAAVARTNLVGGADDSGLTQVLLGTDGAGTVNTTGAQLATALRSANFAVANAAGNSGAGTVTTLARTDLAGGTNPLGVKSGSVENCVDVEEKSRPPAAYHMNEQQRGLQPRKMTTDSDAIRRIQEGRRDITRGKVNQEVQHSSVGSIV